MQGLRSGKYSDPKAISQAFRLSEEYVRRILRCHYLAPDIVAAIIEGTQPRSLTVKRLLRGVPCRWTFATRAIRATPWATPLTLVCSRAPS